ncbi:MAG: ribonuclease J [Pleurocapsa minor GSE-CHR-MK-17-07R]|nr:ribonuclease J [Pleurocapsa minor GSE-CHR-MK 17-07R]
MKKQLRIIPLGGLGEIGKNMTVLEYGRNMIVVDCGLMFPDSSLPGIDLVLPQFDYVVKNQDQLRGIVITHGHMDHIGGLPYLMRQIKAPIYGTDMTIGMIRRQLDEGKVLQQAHLQVVKNTDSFQLGPFKINLFPVAHSIPGSVGLVIDTPVGAVVHTGDYKLDETPAGGQTTDLARLKKLTPNGVLALMADSTNADRPGSTPTEKRVTEELDRLFTEAKDGRIIIATFASLLARLQEIILLAKKHGRKVALTGRSLQENMAIARELGYIKIPDGTLVEISARVPDKKLVILSTGSQGEPRSALNRMAEGEHREVTVRKGDTIIISGGTIPGNEEEVGRMLNKLFARGANVIYGKLADIHVSGHGSRDEMEIMLQAVQPKFFIPVHGEVRHQHLHARLAEKNNVAAANVYILNNGAAWASDGQKAWLDKPVGACDVMVDGRLVGEVGAVVIQDRQNLSQDGFIVALMRVNAANKLVGEPELITRGFVTVADSSELLKSATREIKQHFRRGKVVAHDNVREMLQNFFYRETQSRPVVLPSIIRV